MTQPIGESLERQLSALTRWNGDNTSLWRSALVSSRQKPKRWTAWLQKPLAWGVAAALLILLPTAIIIAVNAPHLGRSRPSTATANLKGIGQAVYVYPQNDEAKTSYTYQYQSESESASPVQLGTSSTPRLVARKATIELGTPDVRAAFHKAMHLVQQTGGEYIQDSSLSGDENNLYAQLTLRVAENRLSDVLNALRQLGTVRSEQTEGQDVTAQAVDLDAQLRNERRVETEMLELLDKRHDAPLKDILELREKLHEVRREIERLAAQKEQLGRLVSLARVLVLIRNSSESAEPSQGIALYFKESCSTAWNHGLTFFVDTLSFIVAVAVGGMVWWLLALVIGVLVWRWRRRQSRDRQGASGGNP